MINIQWMHAERYDGRFLLYQMIGATKAETARRGVLLNHNLACGTYVLHNIEKELKPGG